MCVIDWGLVADWMTALTGIGVLWIAWVALQSWRVQIRGATRHAVAQETATAARALRYAFYDARSPLIEKWEFPQSYWNWGKHPPPHSAKAEAYAFAYRARRERLWPYLDAVINLRPKCGAVFGDDVAKAVEVLARKVRELTFFMEERVRQLNDGPDAVALWPDQDMVASVRASVEVHSPPDDAYSAEFETALEELVKHVQRDL